MEVPETDNQLSPLADELSKSILDDYRCISVKINYAKDEFVADDVQCPDELFTVMSYFRDSGLEIIYSTCGLHVNGENKKPHVHFHCIVKSLIAGTFQSNNSQHRKRWLAKEGNEIHSFENTSIRFPKKENPVWCHLAYPYKENQPLIKGEKNIKKYKQFLIGYAVNLYQVSLGNRAKQDASEQRKKEARLALGLLCEEHKSEFTSYREMTKWLDVNYIKHLSLEDIPKRSNYQDNCQAVAIKLGILLFSDII